MSINELKAEITYITSLFEDDAMVEQNAAYLADLCEQLAALVSEG